jgi:hypothetical protein
MDIKITLTQEQVAQIIRQQTKLFTRFETYSITGAEKKNFKSANSNE